MQNAVGSGSAEAEHDVRWQQSSCPLCGICHRSWAERSPCSEVVASCGKRLPYDNRNFLRLPRARFPLDYLGRSQAVRPAAAQALSRTGTAWLQVFQFAGNQLDYHPGWLQKLFQTLGRGARPPIGGEARQDFMASLPGWSLGVVSRRGN